MNPGASALLASEHCKMPIALPTRLYCVAIVGLTIAEATVDAAPDAETASLAFVGRPMSTSTVLTVFGGFTGSPLATGACLSVAGGDNGTAVAASLVLFTGGGEGDPGAVVLRSGAAVACPLMVGDGSGIIDGDTLLAIAGREIVAEWIAAAADRETLLLRGTPCIVCVADRVCDGAVKLLRGIAQPSMDRNCAAASCAARAMRGRASAT